MIVTDSPFRTQYSANNVAIRNGATSTTPAQFSNLSFLRSTPPSLPSSNLLAPSSSGGFVSQVQSMLQQVSVLMDLIGAARQSDQSAGVSLLDGAKLFSQNVSQELFNLQTRGGIGGVFDAVPTSIDSLGTAAQQYVLGNLKREFFDAVGEAFGVDVSQLSVTDLANLAYESVFGEGTSLSSTLSDGVAGIFSGQDPFVAGELSGEIGGEISTEVGGATSGIGQFTGALATAYSLYGIINDWGKSTPAMGAMRGATAGAYIGSIIPGVGTLIGGAIGGVAGAISGLFHSGKHKNQIQRDQVREFLRNAQIIDSDNSLQLANGERFDIGKDGGARYLGLDGVERRPYVTDPSNPLTAEAIGLVNPLAIILTGGDPGLSSAFAGYFSNAIVSNAQDLEGVRQNALAIFSKFQVTPEQLIAGLENLTASGKIPPEDFAAYANGVRTLLEGFSSPS